MLKQTNMHVCMHETNMHVCMHETNMRVCMHETNMRAHLSVYCYAVWSIANNCCVPTLMTSFYHERNFVHVLNCTVLLCNMTDCKYEVRHDTFVILYWH